MKRAIVAGLLLGLIASAALLSWQAWSNAHFDCDAPGTNECAFDVETHLELARLQSYTAVGLALIAGGAYLFARRR